jgi:SAM-dependent methyltransferase
MKSEDTMDNEISDSSNIRHAVRERYGQLARDTSPADEPCCGPSDCCGDAPVELSPITLLYETSDVTELPPEVTQLSLGCGDPVTLATLQPGETVLDLGSGGGIDCFLAAKRVGPTGRVIGVDMTADMIDRARANGRKIGAGNVEFRLGEIEHLPVADGSVDVIISNCVINLSPDKPQVFRDAFRALRSGGRLAVSDIVTRAPLPDDVKRDLGAWASCIAGAWVDADYASAICAAGFVDVRIEEKRFDEQSGEISAADDCGCETTSSSIYSARITARKP